MTTEFVFNFQAVFHTNAAPECKELTQKCVKSIIGTMKVSFRLRFLSAAPRAVEARH